ncbi:AAA family ATPase [Nocardia sp. NPDC051756]|uniref:AAA family ATPase n=1 Tax=Nocardia sp. NPDC051756 TaxID=3154751 RepID=UPI0034296E25
MSFRGSPDQDKVRPALLVVIRGNSASGKSTVATAVQRRFGRGECAVVAQDTVRRQMLREFDEPGAFNIRLIDAIWTIEETIDRIHGDIASCQ